MWGQIFILDCAAKPPVFWDQSVEGGRLFMPSSALAGYECGVRLAIFGNFR